MKEITGITNIPCQALKQQSYDVVNIMHLVCTTKAFIQELRENSWNKIFTCVKSFCKKINMILRFLILMVFIQQQYLGVLVLK